MIIEQWLVGPSAMLTLLNVAIAVTLVCAIGMAAARVAHSTPLQHAILLSALLLVLLTPMMIGIAQTQQLTWMTIHIDGGWMPRGQLPANGIEAETFLQRDSGSLVAAELRSHSNATKAGSSQPWGGHDSGESRAAVQEASSAQTSLNVSPSRAGSGFPMPAFWLRSLGTAALVVWIFGSLVAFVRLTRGYLLVLRLRRSLRIASDQVQRLTQSASERLERPVAWQVFESNLAPTPLVVGLWRPFIVLPSGIERTVGATQLEGMLVHELAHIARRDPWFGLLQCVAAVIFWWQPLVRRLNSRLSSVREDLCDNHAIGTHDNRDAYARSLVDLAAHVTLSRALPVTVGLLEERDGLEGRVVRLLDRRRDRETRLSRASRISVGAFSIIGVLLLVATSVRVVHASPAEAGGEVTLESTEIRVRNHDQLVRAARAARPGTTILLEPGTYRGGINLDKLRGSAGHPIVIAAADPKHKPIIEGGSNCLRLTDSAYVELRNLVLQGARVNGLNIDDGGSFDTPAHHILLHALTVRNNGSDGNHDGMKLSGVDDFRVELCTVQRWGKKGSGIDMVGCHRGIVTGSSFRDGDRIFGNAVQMKGGCRDITVSFCRFNDAGGRAINLGGSTNPDYFRPRPQGYEAKDIIVEDCTFIGSGAPLAFVGVDGATVRYNTIYRPTRWVMRILQENQQPAFVPCRNGRFTNNIIAFRSNEVVSAVNIGAKTDPKSFQFSDNHWYCIDRPEKTKRIVQLPTSEVGGTYAASPQFVDPENGILTLHRASPVRHAGPRLDRQVAAEDQRDSS